MSLLIITTPQRLIENQLKKARKRFIHLQDTLKSEIVSNYTQRAIGCFIHAPNKFISLIVFIVFLTIRYINVVFDVIYNIE